MRIGNHIIAIYTDAMSSFDEAIEFLKKGIDKDESIMFITEVFTKDEVLDRMSKEWNVDARKLEEVSDIIVKTTREWYFPHGPPDSRRILAMWNAVVGLAILRNKKGLRVFAETAAFFKNGFGKHLIDYECFLEPQFNIPLTALCAYTIEDISTFGPETVDKLQEHHVKTWA